jgi:tetratricopeptide (TPR) repeat protein/Flp pilus assembly secretin CpaC
MIKVQTLSLRGLCASALLAIAACSGTPATEKSPTGAAPNPTNQPDSPTAGARGQNPQGQPSSQALLKQALENAQRSLQLMLFEDARNEAAFALELDNGNQQARDILNRCNEVMGNTPATVGGKFDSMVIQNRIAGERERSLIQHELDLGSADFDLGSYGRAAEHFERALSQIRFSVYLQPNDKLHTLAEARLQEAQKAKAEADKIASQRAQAASQDELARIAKDQQVSREVRLDRLLADANVEFQRGNYKQSVASVEQALLLDPTNPTALALRDLADRARHSANMELHRERWKQEWNNTFTELQSSNVPQTDVVKFDPARWAVVSQREPANYTASAEIESPENRLIRSKLDNTVIEHRFAGATVDAWSTFYAGATGVTFQVTPKVKEMAADSTTLTDFRLPRMSVAQALKVIQTQTGVAWKISNGIVQLVGADEAVGTLYQARYRVTDLVQGVKGRPGPDLRLSAPGEDAPTFAQEEGDPTPSVVDDGKLKDMITNTIATGKWEGAPYSLAYQAGTLIVRADAETQDKVNRLLNDLRRHVGIQIDVEAKFLKVEDDFLQDVGVDLRGLGNQASQGVPGRGLETRPNVGFDDFGPKQNQNAATPGQIGTGTEPGVFFDNGSEGDYLARVENLYDQTLSGKNGGLNNAGGMSLQYAYLGDTQVEVVLRAVQKQERSEQIDAPRLLIYNNTRASMSYLRNIAYIKDFEVEIAQAAAVANPVIGTVRDGVALDVRPVVDSEFKFITMELRPTVMTLQLPIPTFTTTLGVGQPISIQLPSVTLQRIRTTVTMPDGGTMMLGGMRIAERVSLVSGVPILKDLPGLSFLFSRKGTSVVNRKILILISAKIILMEEKEPVQVTAIDGSVVSAK